MWPLLRNSTIWHRSRLECRRKPVGWNELRYTFIEYCILQCLEKINNHLEFLCLRMSGHDIHPSQHNHWYIKLPSNQRDVGQTTTFHCHELSAATIINRAQRRVVNRCTWDITNLRLLVHILSPLLAGYIQSGESIQPKWAYMLWSWVSLACLNVLVSTLFIHLLLEVYS